jgi:hypothetical protein
MISIIWTKYDSYFLTRNIGAYYNEYMNGRHILVLDDDMYFDNDYLVRMANAFQTIGITRPHGYFGGGVIFPWDKWSTVLPAVEFVLRSVTFLVHQVRHCKDLLLWDEWIIYYTLWPHGKSYNGHKPTKNLARHCRGIPQKVIRDISGPPLIPPSAITRPCSLPGKQIDIRTKVTAYLVHHIRTLYDKNRTDLMPDVVHNITTELLPRWMEEEAKLEANLSTAQNH